MKKTILLTLVLIVSCYSYAQIPTGYYNTAIGTGYTLKTQLNAIITNGHIDQGYNALDNEYSTSDADNYYDMDANASNTVLDMYSENPTATDAYNFIYNSNDECGNYNSEGDCFNKEHIFPQGFYNEQLPMKSDIHHVVPTDGRVNGFRSTFPFGEVGTNLVSQSGISNPTLNGSKLGDCIYPGYTNTVFEPIDEFKGDIARMLLYFAVRYENDWNNSGWDSHTTSNNMLNGTSNQFYETWYINLLLDWHNNDAVNQREIDRNNTAYNYQGNRNPFIDNASYANLIWNPNPDTQDPSVPNNLIASNPTSNSIQLNWIASTDNNSVVSYDIYQGGTNMYNSTTNSFTVTGLNPTTQYCFTVLAKDQAGNTSAQSIQDCETTLMTGANGSSCVMEDFENIGTSEGSYATRDWNDANGSAWQATDARTDLSITSKSITIRNGSLTSPTISGGIGNLTVTTKRYFGGSSGSFSVFINGSATSVGSIPYGNENEVITTTISNINIQGNISIVLTNSSSSNRIAIDDLNWTCYSVLSSDSFTKQDFTLYPNPVTSNQLNINSKKDLNVSIYNLLGKRVFNTFAFKGKNSLNLKDLKSGIYLIKLSSNDKLITKKLIIK